MRFEMLDMRREIRETCKRPKVLEASRIYGMVDGRR